MLRLPTKAPDSGGTGPGGTYSPADLRTCYQIPAYGSLVPQSVAVFEQGGFYSIGRQHLPQNHEATGRASKLYRCERVRRSR